MFTLLKDIKIDRCSAQSHLTRAMKFYSMKNKTQGAKLEITINMVCYFVEAPIKMSTTTKVKKVDSVNTSISLPGMYMLV